MNFTEALLIIVILILVFLFARSSQYTKSYLPVSLREKMTVAPVVPVQEHFGPIAPENKYTEERAEHFENLAKDSHGDYGMTGDYNEYIANMGVSEETRRNNADFVSDRLANSGSTSTAVYVDDSLEDQTTPWQGLRRPEGVPLTGMIPSLPDIDFKSYDKQSKIKW